MIDIDSTCDFKTNGQHVLAMIKTNDPKSTPNPPRKSNYPIEG